MKPIRLKSMTAALCLCMAAAGAGAQQHMGGGRTAGGHTGGARPGGAHVGSRPAVTQLPGSVGMRHGGFNNGGFNNGGFNNGGHQHGGFNHGGHQHGGHFVRGVHGGVAGVWWVSGGIWYPWNGYYASGYPYAYAAAPDYRGVWYYCQSVGGYYPYVSYCPEGWIPVAPYAY